MHPLVWAPLTTLLGFSAPAQFVPAPIATAAGLAGGPEATRPAPTPEEGRQFDAGMAALGRRDAAAALAAFRAGYAVAKDPAFLIRIAEAEEAAGRPADAVATYGRYLKEVPDAADRADVERRIGRLIGQNPTPPADPTGSFGGSVAPASDPTGSTPPNASPAPPSAGGVRAAQATPAAVPAPAGRAQSRDDELAQSADQDGNEPASGLEIASYSLLGLGAVGLGVAAFSAASAAAAEGDVDRLVRYRDEKTGQPLEYADVAKEYEDAYDRGRRADAWTRAALIGTGVCVGSSLLLLLVDAAVREPGHEDGASARLGVTPSGGLAGQIGWRF